MPAKKCLKCGGLPQTAKYIDYAVFQSDLSWNINDAHARVVARSPVHLKTRFGNYRLGAGAQMEFPTHIARDLINSQAPIWIAA